MTATIRPARPGDESDILRLIQALADYEREPDAVETTAEELRAHLFADDLRGTAEGHVPWDLVEEPNTMTNATVAEVEEVGDQRELKVSYKQGDGEQKTEGSQTIYVPDDLAVVKMEAASDRSMLKPGQRAFLVVRDDANGSRTALAVVVGEEGATPPM